MITSRKRSQVCLMGALSLGVAKVLTAQTATLSVDAASSRHPISPNIYGIVNYGLSAQFAEEIKVPNIRWGGDGTTRYNWEVDSSNAGFDWYFMGGNGTSNPVPSASVDLMINTYKPAGAAALITIPIIPYINSTSAWTCSFPISIYGAQASTNPYVHPNGETCGNSLTTSGAQLADNDVLANHVPNSVTLQQAWLQHLVATFGPAAKSGVSFYQLDNEPGGWANTHRDIEPTEPAYSVIVSLGQQYAAMIKQVDPTAMVMGPSDFTLGGWIGTPSQQANLFAGQYYLQQMALHNQQTGVRILDYFDEHYYRQFSSPTSQLASTRTLWDPTYNGGTWVEQYEFNGPMQLIPRFHQWISQYYPGTKLAFSEYSIDSGNKLITDALAEADILGIFGQQAVDFADMWNAPASTDPIAYAFRLYRNYDGQGSQFGATGVAAVSSNPSNLSIYAAERATDSALTVVVINKTTAAIQTNLSVANFTPAGAAEVYDYSGTDLTHITAQGIAPIVAGELSYKFPAYSATLLVLKGSQQTGQLIANGTYRKKNLASSLVLDDPGLSKKAGAQMIEWPLNNGANQHWTFAYAKGYYTIQNGASALYLTDPNAAGETQAGLTQQPLSALGDAQLWSTTAGTGTANSYTFRNKATGLVIADPASATVKGTGIVVETPNGGTNEVWTLE